MNVTKPPGLTGVLAVLMTTAVALAPGGIACADPATTTSKPAADSKTPAETKPAASADTKSDGPAADKKFTKTQIEAFLSKCSDEADAKGLDIKKGKGAARKAFRRECMHKFGVDPK